MRRREILIGAGGLIAVQVGLVVGYRTLKGRAQPPRFGFETLGGATQAPPLAAESAPGRPRTLAGDRPALVHFWATWCAPCRTELPALLALARTLRESHRTELLAVSVDDDWTTLAAFFGGAIPAEVLRNTEPGSERRWGADVLPDTYLVDPRGQLRERYRGARDWTSEAARRHLQAALDNAAR